ncbi:hypothetical protein OE88DRAFT_758361 [Heliocybe sulcata]|uniref:Uncharacterized protein n=1 Tax=Heliocybe sulcata TaxID=5364 RepID=A0A5C3MS75_9AGAM|nr:hypothetical protein OE88DRAFT_758361 [Heliocybe sulcata]
MAHFSTNRLLPILLVFAHSGAVSSASESALMESINVDSCLHGARAYSHTKTKCPDSSPPLCSSFWKGSPPSTSGTLFDPPSRVHLPNLLLPVHNIIWAQ